MKPTYKLSYGFIAQLAKLVQLSMLTGEPLKENMLQMRVEVGGEDGNEIVLTPEYEEYFENCLETLLQQADAIQENMRNTPAEA